MHFEDGFGLFGGFHDIWPAQIKITWKGNVSGYTRGNPFLIFNLFLVNFFRVFSEIKTKIAIGI